MATSTLPLGQAIREATRFLVTTHEDLWELIRSLDALMAQQKWSPPKTTAVTAGLGNGLGSALWVARSIWRVYAPEKEMKKEVLERVAIYEFALAPEKHGEAVCLCVAALFRKPTAFDDFWDQWIWQESDVLGALPMGAGPVDVPRSVLDDRFVPAADRAKAFVVPLERLGSEAALQKEVVGPLLALAKF